MKLSLFLGVGVFCMFVASIGGTGYVEQAWTESEIAKQVDKTLATADVTLQQVIDTALPPIDKIRDKLGKSLVNNPLLKPIFGLVNSKALSALAPPLKYDCDSKYFKSETPPKSVHELRIGDIDIIAALGDSIEAGLGTCGDDPISATTRECRGYVSKIGGTGSVEKGNTTIPNIMRDVFLNTKLKGYSTGEGSCLPEATCSGLNVATIYALHPTYILQSIALIKKLILSPNYKPDEWKMIHIFYGPNDLCLLCEKIHYTASQYVLRDIRLTVQLLRVFLKNVIVYLHVPYDITPLKELRRNLACSIIQTALCPCMSLDFDVKANQMLIAKNLEEIANSPEFHEKDDFNVQLIKHLTNTPHPRDAYGNLQPEILGANCLHPSRAAHYIHSGLVIEEMFTAPADRPLIGNYTVNIDAPRYLKCPTAEHPYLRTEKN